jgi:hypothetical protein
MGKGAAGDLAQQFKQRILHTYFVRCGMSLILAVVVASGLLTSKLLLECGLLSLRVRYPIALFASFLAFLLLIKVWIWYVFCRRSAVVDLTNIDAGGGGGNSGSMRFGGGDSGGGGASDSWEEGSPAQFTAGASRSSPGGGGGGGGFDLDLGDDWAILLLIAALVLAIVGAGGYLIYTAPNILPEAAWQVALASGLARISKPTAHQNWLTGVLRASGIPFAVVLIFVVALAWVAQDHCPGAVKLAEALYCAGR